MALTPYPTTIAHSRVTSHSLPFISLKSYSSNLHLSRKPHRTCNLFGDFSSPCTYKSLIHTNVCSKRQRGLRLLIASDTKTSGSSGEEDKQALDAVLKFYSAIKNKNISGLSDIIGDECRCECNFFSFFQAFHGKKQVMEFFSYLIKSLGNRIQIVVQPTLHDGMNVGVHWKLEWSKIHVPSGKGFSFHICQTYHGRVVIRNMEMFMEPLLHFEPIRLFFPFLLQKMMAYLTTILDKTNSYVVSNNKAARVLSILLVLLLIAALLIFLRLTSYRPMP